MRILILHMRYHPDLTGTGPLVTQLARDLAAEGDEVLVITSAPHYGQESAAARYSGWLVHRATEDGVQVWRTLLYLRHSGSVLGRGLDYLIYTVLSTVVALGAGSRDAVLCIAPPITVGFTGWLVRLLRGARLVFNAQDIWPDGLAAMGRVRSPFLLGLLRTLERFTYHVSDAVVVVSEGMRQNLLRKNVPPEKVTVIPNWVDTAEIRPVDLPNDFRQEYGLGDSFVALFAGNLGFAAGIEQIVECAAILERTAPEICFLIVGEGSARDSLRKMVDDFGLKNVRFLTTQPKERVAELYGAADVSLVTLRQGMGSLSVPSKAYAIMASGRPLLAAVPKDSAIRQLVADAGCGVCVRPEDPQALADALLQLAGDPERRSLMGRRGRQYAEANTSRRAATQAYRALLSRLTTSRVSAEASGGQER